MQASSGEIVHWCLSSCTWSNELEQRVSPFESFFIEDDGMPIPLACKSIFFGYLRIAVFGSMSTFLEITIIEGLPGQLTLLLED